MVITLQGVSILIVYILAVLLDYFRNQNYKQNIPLFFNIFFYIFISISLVSDSLLTLIIYLSGNEINIMDTCIRFSRYIIYIYFSIMIWYDNLEGIVKQQDKSEAIYFIIKLLIIIFTAILLHDYMFTFTNNQEIL